MAGNTARWWGQETCKVLNGALANGELSMEEHRQRVERGHPRGDPRRPAGPGDDLQADNAAVASPAVKPPSIPGRRGILAGAFVASVLLGVGIGWGLYGNIGSPLDFTKDPGAKPDGVAAVVLTPRRQLHSLGGITGLLEHTRKRFGHTMGFRLVVYPDYALLDRRDPADDRRVLSYTHRGGWGDPSSTARGGAGGRLVDLGKFDVETTVGILRGARKPSASNR